MSVRELLREQEVEIEPVVAMLPTVTSVGMTALMPISGENVTMEVKGNGIHPKIDGVDMSVRANRLAYLTARGASCREIGEIETASDPPAGGPELLVVFGHEEVDKFGHGSAETLIRHVDREVERLALLIRRLHRWGYPSVHVVTDHGFILLDEEKLPPVVPCDKDWCYVRKERFALVPANVDLPLVTFPFAWDASMRVAVPPGSGLLHGGEVVFARWRGAPGAAHSASCLADGNPGGKARRRRDLLPASELLRSAVKVVLRPKAQTGAARANESFRRDADEICCSMYCAPPSGERKSVWQLVARRTCESRGTAGK